MAGVPLGQIAGFSPRGSDELEVLVRSPEGTKRHRLRRPWARIAEPVSVSAASDSGNDTCDGMSVAQHRLLSTTYVSWAEHGTAFFVGEAAAAQELAGNARLLEWRELVAAITQPGAVISTRSFCAVSPSDCAWRAGHDPCFSLAVIKLIGTRFMCAVATVDASGRASIQTLKPAGHEIADSLDSVTHLLALDDKAGNLSRRLPGITIHASQCLACHPDHPLSSKIATMQHARTSSDLSAGLEAVCAVALPFAECIASIGGFFPWPQMFSPFPFETAIKVAAVTCLASQCRAVVKQAGRQGGSVECPAPGIHRNVVGVDIRRAYPATLADVLDATKFGPSGEWYAHSARRFLLLRDSIPSGPFKSLLVMLTGNMFSDKFDYGCDKMYLEMTKHVRKTIAAASKTAAQVGTVIAIQTDSVMVALDSTKSAEAATEAAAKIEQTIREFGLRSKSEFYSEVAMANASSYVGVKRDTDDPSGVVFRGVSPAKASCPPVAKIICRGVAAEFFRLIAGMRPPTAATLADNLMTVARHGARQLLQNKRIELCDFVCGFPDSRLDDAHFRSALDLFSQSGFRGRTKRMQDGTQRPVDVAAFPIVWIEGDGPTCVNGTAAVPDWRARVSCSSVLKLYVEPFVEFLVQRQYSGARVFASAPRKTVASSMHRKHSAPSFHTSATHQVRFNPFAQ